MAKQVKNPNYKGKKKISLQNIKKYLYVAAVVFIVAYYLLGNLPDQQAEQGETGSNQFQSVLTDTVSAGEGIELEYELAGSSQANMTDKGGNATDRSDWLVSVKSYKDVMPQGFSLESIPEYNGAKYVPVNGNVPYFTENEKKLARQGYFEYYGDLDSYGRCTVAFDCLGRETMPPSNQKRGDISSIHPTGWKQARYDCVDSETVMTRAHLAGYILSAENANEKNLVTGTRYMNSDSMLEFENEVRYYIYDNSGKHVLYRVTPIYKGSELMPRGILMEARSVEDSGFGLQYCVYVYNVQPGIEFDYSTGRSQYTGIFFDTDSDTVITDDISLSSYGLDKATNTIHSPFCSKFAEVSAENRTGFAGDTEMQSQWAKMGYTLCSECLK